MLFFVRKEKPTDGSSCTWVELTAAVRVLEMMVSQLLQKPWQQERRKNVWHGSEQRPTMYLASMDIQTVFDMAGPKAHCETLWVIKSSTDGR